MNSYIKFTYITGDPPPCLANKMAHVWRIELIKWLEISPTTSIPRCSGAGIYIKYFLVAIEVYEVAAHDLKKNNKIKQLVRDSKGIPPVQKSKVVRHCAVPLLQEINLRAHHISSCDVLAISVARVFNKMIRRDFL